MERKDLEENKQADGSSQPERPEMSPAHQVETLEFSLTAADGRVFCLELHEGRSVLAGRDLGAEVVIPDGRVSRHHSSLSLEDSGLWIEDLHSQNGTMVNNEKVQRALLQDGDAISLGGYQMSMTVTGLEKSSPGELARRGSAAREVVSADCADLDGDTAGDTNLELYLGRLADRLEAGFLAAFRVDHAAMTVKRLAQLNFEARQFHGAGGKPGELPNEFLDSVIDTAIPGWRKRPVRAASEHEKNGGAYAAAPVTVSGEVVGLVYIEKRSNFEPLDIEILSGFCERLGGFFKEETVLAIEKDSAAPAKGFYKRVSGEEAGIGSSGGIRAKGGIAEVTENLVDTVGDQADL